MSVKKTIKAAGILPVVLLVFVVSAAFLSAAGFSPADVMKTRNCSAAVLSPDGRWVAFTVSVPRDLKDEPGPAYSELHVLSVADGLARPFITGKVRIAAPQWRPDGKAISFITSRGENQQAQVWSIPLAGGEASVLTSSATSVLQYRWHPAGDKLFYTASTSQSERQRELRRRGFNFIYYEEDIPHRNLYLLDLARPADGENPRRLTEDLTVWSFEISPDGRRIALAHSRQNLVDHQYMFQELSLLDPAGGGLSPLVNHQGKMGSFAFSPDGREITYTASLDISDHAVSQLYRVLIADGSTVNLTPTAFRGHIEWSAWLDGRNLVYLAAEGVWNNLYSVSPDGRRRRLLLSGEKSGLVFSRPVFGSGSREALLVGNDWRTPSALYHWVVGREPRLLTDLNPWVHDRVLGRQEIIRYQARDGQQVEGLLVYPLDYQAGTSYPLVVSVHGGPEAHHSNGWLTGYLNPAQVLAARGYLVFFPNYRASTGYGVAFAMEGFMDPAGKEFDDIADGIEYLVAQGLADPERVGLGGGSYGGYAAAWFSSYYTRLVRAAVMFVGISNLISKRGTTDIPWEELHVHSGKKLEEMWELSLQRSPIYWAGQSKSAVLIMHGTEDTRVHPGQSLEYYRQLKMNDHPAVRLVLYPGEGHGNARQTGRWDVLCRHLQWYDWYLRDLQPLDGPMPPLDVSDCFELQLEPDKKEK